MTVQEIWTEFVVKLNDDSFEDNDFLDDIKSFLLTFLTGKSVEYRRKKFIE